MNTRRYSPVVPSIVPRVFGRMGQFRTVMKLRTQLRTLSLALQAFPSQITMARAFSGPMVRSVATVGWTLPFMGSDSPENANDRR